MTLKICTAALAALTFSHASYLPAQQPMNMQMNRPSTVGNDSQKLPTIGVSIHPEGGATYTLEQLEKIALEENSLLSISSGKIAAAKGWEKQAGLYPNPVIGYSGDELRGGAYRSGRQGFFVEQTIPMGGKLEQDKHIASAEIEQAQASAESMQYVVLTKVRIAHARVLAAQETLEMRKAMLRIARSNAEAMRQLSNTGQADETEVLEAEIAAEKMQAEVEAGVSELRATWATLAQAEGKASFPQGVVQGNIEILPEISENTLLLEQNTSVQIATAQVKRAQAAVERAKRAVVPDVQIKGGLHQDNEPLTTPQSRVGLVGFAEIGMNLPLWNRNQGNVDAAQAELMQAEAQLNATKQLLVSHATVLREEYRSARTVAVRYHDAILPRVKKAYQLMDGQYGLMSASWPRVLALEEQVAREESSYLRVLEEAHVRYAAFDGFLHTGVAMEEEKDKTSLMKLIPSANASSEAMP